MIGKFQLLKDIFKPVLILAIFFCVFHTLEGAANWREVKIFIRTEDYLKAMIYACLYVAVLISLFILLFHTNRKVNLFTYALLVLTIGVDYTYRMLNGSGLTYEDVLLAQQNIGFDLEGEVLSTFAGVLLSAAGIAIAVLLSIIVLRRLFRTVRIHKHRYLFVPLLVFIAVLYLIYISNANRLAYPVPYKVPALLIYASQKGLYSGERDEIYLHPGSKPVAKHIVWIVDESVRPDVFQINGFPKATTPFLSSIQDSILNYGIASSGSVCSDYSHIMLMSGLRLNELPDKRGTARKKPTVFQYANRAGFRSNLVYVPGDEDVPKGYMTQSDFRHIQHRFHSKKIFPEAEAYMIDIRSIDILEQIIDTQESSFTYFLKYGCHFHYESTYPPEKRFFEPVQDIHSWKRDDREKLLNSYYNAIRWEVDFFFETLYKRFAGRDVLVIYTSDHGQHLMEHPGIQLTHCVKTAAPVEMAMVPLFLLPMNTRIKERVSKDFRPENVNHASHFNIFPSTLILMGYDRDAVLEWYETPLFDSLENTERKFVSGDIFGRSRMFMNTFDPASASE